MDEIGSNETRESRVSPDEAFQLLGDETRIAILQALWETSDEPVPFSELRQRIGNPDSGHFNYHLDKLADHFVRKTDDGYVLRAAGCAVVQAVLSGALTRHASVEPFEYDEYCPYCGAEDAMVFEYEDDSVTVWCHCCEPDATTERPYDARKRVSAPFPPAALRDRSAGELVKAFNHWLRYRGLLMTNGVCPDCSGKSVMSISTSSEQGPERETNSRSRPASATGAETAADEVAITYQCEVCTNEWHLPAWFHLLDHPAVVSFYHEHGVDITHASLRELKFYHQTDVVSVRVESDNPLQLSVRYPIAGDVLAVTVDDTLEVIDVAHTRSEVDTDDLREQFITAFEDADYPIWTPMNLVPTLPEGSNTQFKSGDVSISAGEMTTAMAAIEMNNDLPGGDFPYEDAESFVDDFMESLEEEGYI